MTFQSLLPGLASPLRRTVEEASSKTFDLPFALRDIDNPDAAPEAFIPFMAWGLSTDLWDRNWPIEKKRAAAKAWWRLHRKKGTLTGIKEAVRFFSAEVVAVRRPPDAAFPDPTMTREERDAYLARFQQIRFYSHRSRGSATYGAYLAGGYRLSRLFIGETAFPTFSDAAVRIGRRAYLFEPRTGDEAPVRRALRVTTTETRRAVEFEEVVLPGYAGKSAFAGRPPIAKTFTADTGARGRLYSISIDVEYSEARSSLHISGILPSGTPIDVRPRRAALPGSRVKGQLFPSLGGRATEFVNRHGDGVHRTFLPPSTAPLRIFDQIFLFDPQRHVDKRGARTFLNNVRLGMPPFHARITLKSQAKLSPFSAQRFVAGYFVTTSKARLTNAIEAIRLSKSLRDKVIVTAKTMRPATAGDGFEIGKISVGTWVRDL